MMNVRRLSVVAMKWVCALALMAAFGFIGGRTLQAADIAPIAQEGAGESAPTGFVGRTLSSQEAALAAQAVGAADAMLTIEPEEPRWALFGDAAKKVAYPSMVVDGGDNLHIAYVDYVPLAEDPKAIYLYCAKASKCHEGEGWSGIEFGADVLNVMLDATRAGKPRLLLQQQGVVFDSGKDYYYAACDGTCDQMASWQIGYVTSTWGTAISDALDGSKAMRAFALDAQDRPGFAFYDRNYFYYEPDHIGGYYTWCESNCTTGTPEERTWQEVYMGTGEEYDTDIYSFPVLQYTSDNKPRILVEVTTGSAGMVRAGIIYKSCDANCDQPENWKHTKIADRGFESYVSWDMTLDAQNRPHVALYQGSFEGGKGHYLLYLTCAANCDAPASWKTLNLGADRGEGESPDIEVQPNGKPAITYLHNGGLGVYLARCTGDCATAAGWKHTILDTATDLEADFPVARPITCDAGFWDARTTRLAFTSEGKMRVVYDASYEARCLYEDPTDPNDTPYYKFHQIRHAVRVLIWEPVEDGGDNGGDGGGNGGDATGRIFLSFVQR